ncbi:Glutamine-rich protein 2 [Amphibalanus amphitrite]|uniref:Glutamine-rich protein 2 n=1 Tax=Amphibalanus amphitrite TaxID=1232801 RepID=A0A6A4WRB2_AMPAM|nr:Glutamine-rich protein 2 [Amphibalanus amphitrite]
MAAVAEEAPAVGALDAPETDEEHAAEDGKKTIISLGELVDLALCTPEPGAVNFNLLRAVLHALVQRLDLVDIKAEILDEDTDNVFSQIMENAEKLGLKDMRARQSGSARASDGEKSQRRGESKERRRHKSRRSDRSRGGSSRRGSSERAPSQSAAGDEQRPAAGAPGSGAAPAAPSGGARRSRSGSGAAGAGSGAEHSDEFEDVRETFCPPDSAGHPDVARSRSLSGQRVSAQDGEVTAEPAGSAGSRRASSSGARRSASAEGRAEPAEGEGEPADGAGAPSESHRLSRDRRSSSDSLGLSSGLSSASDSESRARQGSRKATLSELASERLRRSGRQSAVSISSNIEGTAVLSDYTNLDRLEKKMADIQQKMETLELADMLPKVRELQKAITGSQEDVQGLWQSLQLMKKVDANEEGIDKLTHVIENAMAKLKKVRKHTDRLDKQLADMMGHHKSSSQSKSKTDSHKPVTMAEMETKYNEIKSVIEGLMSSMGQDPDAPPGEDGEDSSDSLRRVGAGIVTWNVLESALENIRGEVKEISEVNDQALSSVEEQQTEARQQELRESAAADHSTQVSKVKQLLANLSRLVDKHRALEKRVVQMEESMGDGFSDKVLEQLTLLKASASQIQDLRNKLSSSTQPVGGGAGMGSGGGGMGGGGGGMAARAGAAARGGMGHGWSELDVADSAGSMGHMVSDDLSLNLSTLREPSQMDLNHLSDWLNYNKARMEQLEKALVSQSEQVRDFGDRLGDQVVSFRDKLERVERELAGMLGRITSAAQKSGMSREDSQALHDAYAKIQTLQMDVEALSNVSKKIVSDRGQIDDELSMLIRALEELKECKVDRATLDELIETKADRSSVEKKVSSWQFEQACQELSEGLGTMLEKMGSQEVDWSRAVDEINADLHRKLDRIELAPLRRYINTRLKNIMTKLNRLIAEDESPDACTTRRKLVRNLNCLSCDDPRKITGLTSAPNVPLLEAFPPSIGDRHQVTYRLGNIRRQQQMRCEPYKDMTGHQGVFRNHIKNEIEAMTHRGIPHHPNCPLYMNRAPHGRCTCVATRFCGGSHTKINCVDTRQRRIGLGAPLLPFGAAMAGQPASGRGSQERVTRTASGGAQRAGAAAGGPRRPGSRTGLPPSSAGSGPRQVRSTGSGLRQKRSGSGLGTKSAPEFPVPFEPPGEGRAEAGEAAPAPAEPAAGPVEKTEEAEVKTETVEEVKPEPVEEPKTEPTEPEPAVAEGAAEPKPEPAEGAESEEPAAGQAAPEETSAQAAPEETPAPAAEEAAAAESPAPAAEAEGEPAAPQETPAPEGETETGDAAPAEETGGGQETTGQEASAEEGGTEPAAETAEAAPAETAEAAPAETAEAAPAEAEAAPAETEPSAAAEQKPDEAPAPTEGGDS